MLIDLTLKINPKNASSDIAKLGHYGTHIDIMDNNEIPIERFITVGKLIDITDIRESQIHLHHLNGMHSLEENDFVIFRSHWLRDKSYGTKEYFFNHPHFADDVINHLIEKNVSFIGLDFPGAQRHEKHILVDRKCADKGIYIIENLNNLHLLQQIPMTAYCFPMHFAGNTGIPIRVLAQQ